jgi:LPS sulfotransferase NodH
MNKYYVIIAHARSGSTLLCRKLEQYCQAKVHMEIFHQNLGVIRRYLGDQADAVLGKFPGDTDAEIRDYIATHPMELLDSVSASDEGGTFIIKVFPGHLKPEYLKQVIEGSSGVILLHRNLLHSYISNVIAREKKVWGGKDTSQDFVHFDSEEMLREVKPILNFYRMANTMLEAVPDIPRAEIIYEDLCVPEQIEEKIREVMDICGILTRSGTEMGKNVSRQDRRTLATDKVDNPEELLAFLEDAGLSHANDGMTAVGKAEFAVLL